MGRTLVTRVTLGQCVHLYPIRRTRGDFLQRPDGLVQQHHEPHRQVHLQRALSPAPVRS